MFYFIGWGLIGLGLSAIISSIVGLFRFPDFYTKIHAASVIDSCGVPLSLVGLACLQDNMLPIIKLILMLILIMLLNPLATHALCRAVLLSAAAYKKNIIKEE